MLFKNYYKTLDKKTNNNKMVVREVYIKRWVNIGEKGRFCSDSRQTKRGQIYADE